MNDHTQTKETLGDDLIYGAKNIGKHTGDSERRAFHLLENGQIPAGKIGGRWVASRRKLREHFERLTEGSA